MSPWHVLGNSDLHYLSARQALWLAYDLPTRETLNLDRTQR